MARKQNIKQMFGHFGRASFLVIALFLIVYLVSVVTSSTDFYNGSAERSASLYFEEDMERANALARGHFDNLYEIVDKVENADSQDAVLSIIKEYIGANQFGDLRYYSRGRIYAPNGAPIDREVSAHEMLEALAGSNREGVSSVYYDTITAKSCIAFFVPVRGSAYVDGVLSIVEARNLINIGEVINEKAIAVAITDKAGNVYAGKTSDQTSNTIGNDFFEFISKMTSDKGDVNRVSGALSNGYKTACTIYAPDENYTVVVSPIPEFSNNLSLITMSISEGLIAPELTYIRHIVSLLVISIMALIIGFIFAMLYYRKSQNAIQMATLTDSRLDCPNKEQFIQVARGLISERRQYAIAVLAIHNYNYLSDKLGEQSVTEVLKFVVKVFEAFLSDDETYGYGTEGRFVILERLNTENAVKDKVRLVENVINKSDLIMGMGVKIRFDVGVYKIVGSRRRTVQEMIDCAKAACEISKNNQKNPYTLFTEKVSEEVAHDERIEALMENALANKEFRLFLQPKYSVSGDRIDSAEALVRWFDPRKGDYMFPGEFIDLFETNGFIVKLDHFIYLEVLEYLSSAAERGEKMVPISVNVSRVTASSDDFLDFYIGNKHKYGIGDGFITLELTESFAMEDYDTISDIVSKLHLNGMRCSIDDFGSGYSSFSILKQVPMDEIKLDRIFIMSGVSKERDDKILEMIIDMAKTIGMTVVQEGVETKADFDNIVAKGCDVIQGYYYAKAIPIEEYRIFISSNTSIKYKSLVK